MDLSELPNGLDLSDVDESVWQVPVVATANIHGIDLSSGLDSFGMTDLLRRIPQEKWDNYHSWRNIALAMKRENSDWLPLFVDGSKRSPNYEMGCCERLWHSINDDYSGTPFTVDSLKMWVREAKAPLTNKYEVLTLTDLRSNDYRVTYLVDDTLVAGQPCIVAAPQKTLKTTLLLWLSLCLSTGKPFLGKRCQKSKVLFMSGESGLATLQQAAVRMLAALGSPDDNGYFHICGTIPYLNDNLDQLKELLAELSIEVLIIDPLYLAMDGTDANNLFKMGQQLRPISDLCTALGITLILAHHCTKSAGKEHSPLELTDIAWSGFGEFARQWLLLSRRENYVDGSGQHNLFLRAGGSAGHSNLLCLDIAENPWSVLVQSYAEVKAKAAEYTTACKFDWVQEKLRKEISADKWPLTKTEIRDAIGINGSTWTVLFDRLVSEGILKTEDKCDRGAKYNLAQQISPQAEKATYVSKYTTEEIVAQLGSGVQP